MNAGDRIQFRPSHHNVRASGVLICRNEADPKWLTVRVDKQFAPALLLGNYEMASGLLSINVDLHKAERIS